MKVRDLLEQLSEHAADGKRADDHVILIVGRETRSVTTSYSDGTFILVAGQPITRR